MPSRKLTLAFATACAVIIPTAATAGPSPTPGNPSCSGLIVGEINHSSGVYGTFWQFERVGWSRLLPWSGHSSCDQWRARRTLLTTGQRVVFYDLFGVRLIQGCMHRAAAAW